MDEGWSGDDYLILFEESEIDATSKRYMVSQALPGYKLLGLRGWDDFIVSDAAGGTFCVPTVPLDSRFLRPFVLSRKGSTLKSDPRYTGKIKWYVKPVIFGGAPNVGDNVIWVNHEQHAQLVTWWNDHYRSLKTDSPGNLLHENA